MNIKTFLTVSLAFNALFIGMILGENSFRVSDILSPSPAYRPLPDLQGKLPDEKRNLFESVMRPEWEEMATTRSAIDIEKQKALKLLTAESFDEKAYRTQSHRISDMYIQRKRHLTEAVIKIARQFSSAERVVLADVIARSLLVSKAPPTANH